MRTTLSFTEATLFSYEMSSDKLRIVMLVPDNAMMDSLAGSVRACSEHIELEYDPPSNNDYVLQTIIINSCIISNVKDILKILNGLEEKLNFILGELYNPFRE